MLADADVDCIVSDFDMPDQNGIEFLETVREEYPDLPFILYTGKGSEEVASDAISTGVTDYLQKESGTDHHSLLANRIRQAVEAQENARSAEQRQHQLDQILKTVPACVVQLNYEGEFIFANRRAEEVLGLEQTDVSKRTYNDPKWNITDLNGEPIPDEELPFRQVRDSGEPIRDYRHTIEWPDGTRKVLLVNGAPLFESEDTLTGAVFALTDITETIEREQQLRETSRRLDLALRATDTGVWEWNMETDEVIWNETLERLLGIDPGTFGGTFEAHAEYLHSDDIPKVEQAIEDALEGDGEFRAEFRMEREDGEQIWVEGRGELITEDGPRRMVGTTTDITDRKESERALARREVLDPSIELEFHSDQIASVMLEHTECSLEFSLNGIVPRSDGTRLLYGTVRGPTAKEAQSVPESIPTVEEVRLLSTVGDAVRYEVSVGPESIAAIFATFDGELQSVVIENDTCKLIGEFPETVDTEAVTRAVRETYPDIELASQRRIVVPAYLRNTIEDDLTERQKTVLRMAYYANYFEEPRETTGEELADRLGITRQTFNSHLRKAQSKVFHAVFEKAIDLPG